MSLISTPTHIPRMVVLAGVTTVQLNVNVANITMTTCLLKPETSEYQTPGCVQLPGPMDRGHQLLPNVTAPPLRQ